MVDNNMLSFKILSLGESGVDKTQVINRFFENKFDPCSMIGIDFKSKHITFEGKQINLKLWDTAGQERFLNLTQQYYRNADGILLMFDLTNRESFTGLSFWIQQIKLHAYSGSIPVVIVGTKCDLPNHEVSEEEALKFSKTYNCHYFTVSSQKNINIKEAFMTLVEDMINVKSKYVEYSETDEKTTLNLKKIREELRKKRKCLEWW